MRAGAKIYKKTRLSILALVSFIVSWLIFLPVVSACAAVILGASALYTIGLNRKTLHGIGLAVFGIVIGFMQLLCIMVFLLFGLILTQKTYDFNFGGFLMRVGKYSQAIRVYEHALLKLAAPATDFSTRENEFSAYANLGLSFQAIGNCARAFEAHQLASLVAAKELGLSYYGMGVACSDLKEYEKANGYLDKAIEFNPVLVLAYQEKAANLRRLDRFEDSAAACKRTISLFPDFAQAHSTLGLAYEELGRYDEALKAHLEAIRLNPQREFPRERLLYCFSKVRSPSTRQEALQILRGLDASLANNIETQLKNGVVVAPHSFKTLKPGSRLPYSPNQPIEETTDEE